MSRGRLTVLTPFFPDERDSVSGAFVLDHAVALAEDGWQVRVESPTPWLPAPLRRVGRWSHYANRRSGSLRGIDVSRPRYLRPPGRWFRGFAGRSMAWALQRSEADAVIAHTLLPAGEAAVRRLSCPVVIVCHGSEVFQHARESARTLAAARTAIEGAAEVVCVSRALQESLFEIAKPGRSSVVYNGVDTARFVPLEAPHRVAVRRRYELEPDDEVLLFVGLDFERKGLGTLLEAFRELRSRRPRARLLLVGPSDREVPSSLGVIALGRRPTEELPELTGCADAAILPSNEEAFGCTLLEAASCAVPVVGTSVDGIREVVVDEETGLLVPPGDPERLQSAVRLLLDDAELRRRLGAAARKRVVGEFSWGAHARRFGEVLDRVRAEKTGHQTATAE